MGEATSLPLPAGPLRFQASWFLALVENLDEGVFLLDREGKHVLVNRCFGQWLGRTPAEILGRTVRDLYPAPLAERHAADNRRVLGGERLEYLEQWPGAGQPLSMWIRKVPLRDERGDVQGVLGILRDTSREPPGEEHHVQSLKLEALGRLAGGVAHEFNNLLTIIVGNLYLLLEGLGPAAPQQELATAIKNAAAQGAELTGRLLTFARPKEWRPQPVDLNVCLAEVKGLLARTIDPRITLEVRPWEPLPLVRADPGQVTQVLLNLCLNACDAMPRGGRLLLMTEEAMIPSEVAAQKAGRMAGRFVCLRVADTGVGMTPEVQARIFDPFFTTKAPGKGTGLGLSIVQGIVRQHAGWVECTSVPGQGTWFDIYLPVSPEATGRQEPGPSQALKRGEGRTVLLVENEPEIRLLTRMVLQDQGYRVEVAENGKEAVDLYRERGKAIDLVLMDLSMPVMSGQEALDVLLALNPNVRVILTSGYSEQQLRPEVQRRVRGFLPKPFLPSQLIQSVQNVLAEKA